MQFPRRENDLLMSNFIHEYIQKLIPVIDESIRGHMGSQITIPITAAPIPVQNNVLPPIVPPPVDLLDAQAALVTHIPEPVLVAPDSPHRAVLNELADSAARKIASPQRRGTRIQYRGKIGAFRKWSLLNGVSVISPSINDIINFMEYKFVIEGRQARTIQGYKSAFTDYYDPALLNIKRSRPIQRLIRAYFKERPPALNVPKPWDVNKVLDSLKRPPFEPMSVATLKYVTMKTVFLVALATGRRRSEIHALSHKSVKSSVINGNEVIHVKTVMSFLTKNQRENSSPDAAKKIFIPSLKEVLGPDLWDSEDKVLCPVRAIRHYLKRTTSLRKDRKLLFISYQLNRSTDIHAPTISSWIKQIIWAAYGGKFKGVKAHQTRSAGASWAYATGASLSQVMEACYWKSSSTFTSHYLKEYWTSEVDSNMYHLGPFVAAGSIVNKKK